MGTERYAYFSIPLYTKIFYFRYCILDTHKFPEKWLVSESDRGEALWHFTKMAEPFKLKEIFLLVMPLRKLREPEEIQQ